MKQQVIQALTNSTVSNQQVIKAVEETIKILSETENYCLVLMDIVDDRTIAEQIRLAALVQLKINVERRWKPISNKVLPLSQEEKLKIRQTLLTAMIRCQSLHTLIRTYQRIVTLVTINQFSNWMPTQQVSQVIQTQPQNTNIAIVFASAVIEAFSDKANPNKNCVQLEIFLKEILPLLYQLMTGERKSLPLIYLVTKTLDKVFKVELSNTVRQMVPVWMPLLKQIIDHQESTLSMENIGNKNTLDSYFFRAKKWSVKIIHKFFITHASYTYKKQNMAYAQQWISSYAVAFLASFMNAIVSPNLTKTYYYIFKCIHLAAARYADIVQPYVEVLMYKIIPEFVKLIPAEEQLANDDPIELLKKQQDVTATAGDPKSAASYLWVTLSDLKSSYKDKIEGPYLQKSLQWIYQQLSSTDFIQKEMALTLFCRAKFVYTRFPEMSKPIIQVIQNLVFPLLQCDVMMVKIKAIQIFQAYGGLSFSTSSLQKIVQNLYKALAEKDKVLVNIKAAGAFNSMLSHQAVLEMVKPYLKELLQFYIKLISEHEIQNLVACLQGIVQHYSEQINPFAVDLITYLSNQFVRFSDGNNEVAGDANDEGQFQMAAYACIDVIKQIVKANISQDVLSKIDQPIIRILQQSFTHEGSEYFQSSLQLLDIYFYKSTTINPKMWFFYYCILYSINGLPDILRTLQIPLVVPKQKRIIDNLPKAFNSTNLEINMNCIRHFVYKSPLLALQEKDIFGILPLYNIFKIFEHVFNKQNREPAGILNATALIMNILQNTKCAPQMINASWQVIIRTLEFVKSITGRKIAYSAVCLCLFSNVEATIKVIEAQANGFNILKSILEHSDVFEKEYEITRTIIGLSSIFILEKRSEQLDKCLPDIFKFLVGMIAKLAQVRCELDLDEEDDEGDEDGDQINYWNEERDHFRTTVDKIDAALFFETVWKHFSEKQPEASSALNSLLSPAEAQVLQTKLNVAKSEYRKVFSENKQ